MNLTGIDISNAFEAFPALWEEFEQRFQLLLTIHDHIGVFMMPNGRRLLPRHNIHRATCCQYKIGKRLRCFQHCRHNVIVEGEKRRGPFRYQCWRGIVECVVPLFQGKELAATIFAGAFRDPDFPVDTLSRYYRRHYLAMPPWSEEVGNKVAFLLTLMGNALMHLANNLASEYAQAETGRKGQIRQFLIDNASYQVTLADLAHHLGLSVSRTSHIVNELFQCSFTTLRQQEQIKLAKKLLTDGSLSLREVASHCGFQNEFYFSRVFKQHCGLPPGAFRNRRPDQV